MLAYLPGKGFKIYKFQGGLPQDAQIISMTKLTGELLSEENISRALTVNLLPADLTLGFYNQLNNLFLPALVAVKDDNLKRLAEELRAGVESVIMGVGVEDDFIDEKNVRGIFKPADEFDYWSRVLAQASTQQIQKRAQLFSDCFAAIDKQWRDLRQVEIAGLRELSEQTADAMDRLWTTIKDEA